MLNFDRPNDFHEESCPNLVYLKNIGISKKHFWYIYKTAYTGTSGLYDGHTLT